MTHYLINDGGNNMLITAADWDAAQAEAAMMNARVVRMANMSYTTEQAVVEYNGGMHDYRDLEAEITEETPTYYVFRPGELESLCERDTAQEAVWAACGVSEGREFAVISLDDEGEETLAGGYFRFGSSNFLTGSGAGFDASDIDVAAALDATTKNYALITIDDARAAALLDDLARGWRIDWTMQPGDEIIDPDLGPDSTADDIAVESENEDTREMLRGVVENCRMSRDCGREAAAAIIAGEWEAAWEAVKQAASIEMIEGDSPHYGPIVDGLAMYLDRVAPREDDYPRSANTSGGANYLDMALIIARTALAGDEPAIIV